ncbi:MAG: hypothetical protein IPK56_11060 [Elusimicrobia bacterium]|nr:hypothetical protein [Elusimicrobiota bacterium]
MTSVPMDRLARVFARALWPAAVVRRARDAGFTVAHKGVVNIVTSVDKAAERAIRRVIAGGLPDHGFFDGGIGRPSVALPYRWVVDPWTARSTSPTACRFPACRSVWKRTVG